MKTWSTEHVAHDTGGRGQPTPERGDKVRAGSVVSSQVTVALPSL